MEASGWLISWLIAAAIAALVARSDTLARSACCRRNSAVADSHSVNVPPMRLARDRQNEHQNLVGGVFAVADFEIVKRGQQQQLDEEQRQRAGVKPIFHADEQDRQVKQVENVTALNARRAREHHQRGESQSDGEHKKRVAGLRLSPRLGDDPPEQGARRRNDDAHGRRIADPVAGVGGQGVRRRQLADEKQRAAIAEADKRDADRHDRGQGDEIAWTQRAHVDAKSGAQRIGQPTKARRQNGLRDNVSGEGSADMVEHEVDDDLRQPENRRKGPGTP